jgi:hypothetical protein
MNLFTRKYQTLFALYGQSAFQPSNGLGLEQSFLSDHT